MWQLAPLFGVSKSAADRVIDDLAPRFALHPRQRVAKDAVLIVDGTLVPTTQDHNWHRVSTPDAVEVWTAACRMAPGAGPFPGVAPPMLTLC